MRFCRKDIALKKNATVFLTTDGYYYQEGGTEEAIFMSRRFRELLLEIAGQSAHEQEKALRVEFENWKHTKQQINDVLVVGIKYN